MLETIGKSLKSVTSLICGAGSIADLQYVLQFPRKIAKDSGSNSDVVVLVDDFFSSDSQIKNQLNLMPNDRLIFVSADEEPTTVAVDTCVQDLQESGYELPAAVVGVGGGTTLDIAKAVSNILGNGGLAADYQGWDLLQKPGVFKIGIPTISGTGAEATRTCVMTNPVTKVKLGMNSNFSIFDYVILDPDLSATVPRDQYFFTGMDTYIHCIESLSGNQRNSIADGMAMGALELCRSVFCSDDMMDPVSREMLMAASYLGGSAIAMSMVGVIHPFSAALSVVLGFHHGVANCIAMTNLQEFYPEAHEEFSGMVDKQSVEIPKNVCQDLDEDQFRELYDAMIIHENPLLNALGPDFCEILTFDKVASIFNRM